MYDLISVRPSCFLPGRDRDGTSRSVGHCIIRSRESFPAGYNKEGERERERKHRTNITRRWTFVRTHGYQRARSSEDAQEGGPREVEGVKGEGVGWWVVG